MAQYESPTSSLENKDGNLYLLYMHFIYIHSYVYMRVSWTASATEGGPWV